MPIRQEDKTILRELAEQQAGIGALAVQEETAAQWARCNGLQPGKPLVWINEAPWHELQAGDPDGELQLRCSDEFCRDIERQIRLRLYQWKHIRGDMVVEPKLYCPLVVHDTGLGVSEDVDIVRTDERSNIVSRRFHGQFKSMEDVEKIEFPQVTCDAEATARNHERMMEIFDGVIEVEKRGLAGTWFAPWDALIRWWDVQQAMMDLVLKPDLVHAAMDRLVGALLHRLDQWEQLNVLSRNDGNARVGSGGPGYTDELPQDDFDPGRVRPIDLWGSATAQIFSEVSPEMHEEFALRYERRWLDRFGLTYYGCCEPLHLKMGILRGIPNLRKVSMSPRADIDRGAAEVADEYVYSAKPNPAVLATDQWHPGHARELLRELLAKTKGCVVEVIMKDISTVRYEPQRLWDWARIATEETEKFA